MPLRETRIIRHQNIVLASIELDLHFHCLSSGNYLFIYIYLCCTSTSMSVKGKHNKVSMGTVNKSVKTIQFFLWKEFRCNKGDNYHSIHFIFVALSGSYNLWINIHLFVSSVCCNISHPSSYPFVEQKRIYFPCLMNSQYYEIYNRQLVTSLKIGSFNHINDIFWLKHN